MKKRCKTCKYWVRFTKKFDVEYHGEHVGKCISNAFVYTGQGDKISIDEFGYWDTESYHADFETGISFGCVHWEK